MRLISPNRQSAFTHAFDVLPRVGSEPLESLLDWYSRQIGDHSTQETIQALLRAGIERLFDDPLSRFIQSDLCQRSTRAPVTVQRYFGTIDDLEVVARAVFIELNMAGDLRALADTSASGDDVNVFSMSAEQVFPNAGPSYLMSGIPKAANRTSRALSWSLLRYSRTGQVVGQSLATRKALEISSFIRRLRAEHGIYRYCDSLTTGALLTPLSAFRLLGDAGITYRSTSELPSDRLWWRLHNALSSLEYLPADSGTNLSVWPAQISDRSVSRAFPDLSTTTRATLVNLGQTTMDMVLTLDFGLNDVHVEKELPYSRPTVRSYLGNGRQLFATAGLLCGLEYGLEIRDRLASATNANPDGYRTLLLSLLSCSSDLASLSAFCSLEAEQTVMISKALNSVREEIAQLLTEGPLRIAPDDALAVAEALLSSTGARTQWSFIEDLVGGDQVQQHIYAIWNDVLSSLSSTIDL